MKTPNSLVGHFLIARPVLRDPNFVQTVILLLQHDAAGAFGLVVNRPLPPEAWTLPFPLYLGGPCKSEGILMIHSRPEWIDEVKEERQVVQGLYIGDEKSVQKATETPEEEPPRRFRMMTGYSGWGPGQLEQEIRDGSWAFVPASANDLFEIPDQEKWATLMPSSIPFPSDN